MKKKVFVAISFKDRLRQCRSVDDLPNGLSEFFKDYGGFKVFHPKQCVYYGFCFNYRYMTSTLKELRTELPALREWYVGEEVFAFEVSDGYFMKLLDL